MDQLGNGGPQRWERLTSNVPDPGMVDCRIAMNQLISKSDDLRKLRNAAGQRGVDLR